MPLWRDFVAEPGRQIEFQSLLFWVMPLWELMIERHIMGKWFQSLLFWIMPLWNFCCVFNVFSIFVSILVVLDHAAL
ncbi:MAG: hypothetical protein U9R66_03525, partial [Thermodesulfobacteriota bacterium]|nr:hypothetical protein [Thermodesulfobacteriota bacterium]